VTQAPCDKGMYDAVGELTLAHDSLDLRAEPGRTMTVDAAEPNSSTAHALRLPASWAATMPRAERHLTWGVCRSHSS
jgi:hypothetical protein